MAKLLHFHLQTLIPLTISLILSLANMAQSQSDWVSFLYDFSDDEPVTLNLQGDAQIDRATNSLSLTRNDTDGNAASYSAGRALYNPVQFRRVDGAQADFATAFRFLITPNGAEEITAEGLTFFIAPQGLEFSYDSAGENLGLFDRDGLAPYVFAVEFDVSPTEDFDPRSPHIGIDIGSRESSVTAIVEEGLLRNEVTAFIRYVAAAKQILVRAVVGSQSYEVTYHYDLGTLLNHQVQVGLSASTGYAAAHFQIFSWYFDSVIATPQPATPPPTSGAGGRFRSLIHQFA